MDPIPPESDALERNRNESDFERHAEGTTIPLDNLEYPPPRIPPVSITSPESLLHNFSTHSLLVFATIWGVLARLGLEYLGSFSEGNVFKLIWPQIVGCLIMGFVVERKGSFEARYAPLFSMLSVGFCGSMTTFSSWMFDVFAGFSNLDTPALGRFSGFMNGLAITVVTLGLSTASLLVGRHLASFFDAATDPAKSTNSSTLHSTPSTPANTYPPSYHVAALLLGSLSYVAAILLLVFGPTSWRGQATFAIVLGPPATLLRYQLGRTLNPINSRFPLGTFVANILAVLIFAVTAILQRSPSVGVATGIGVEAAALQGVQDGFCGSLSTVSTFVVELRTLRRSDSYRYFAGSWVSAMAVFVVVLGSWQWSGER